MGVVYRAEDTRLRRPVALKFLPDALDEGRKYRFLNEARAAALARHPNICPIHDIEEVDGEIFLVMALIEGETLSRRIARGRMAPAEAKEIAAQVAAGLACAHDLGVVHRDIKSSNIMIDASGHVSIMDFGLALAPEALRLTGEGHSVGTPDYMSPEQTLGKAVDARTDLWSLGAVLFEMLTGKTPFQREHRGAMAHAILNDPIPEMPGVPEDLRRVVGKALAKDPAARWPSAQAMRRALRGEPEVTEAEEAPTRTVVSAAVARPRRWVFALAALVMLLLAAGYGFYRLGGREPVLPEFKRIAILPRVDASAVSSGIDEAITGALAAQPNVTVFPSTDLRTSKVTTVEGARKLHNANLVLTWTEVAAGDALEFTFDLIDVATERPFAQRKLRYDLRNSIVSRDQAVSQIFGMLHLQAPPVVAETARPGAYSAYLEGRHQLARFDNAVNVDKAIASFLKAIEMDNAYALAFVGLAEAYWRKGLITKDPKWAELAVQNASHAARIDPQLAGPHVVLGSVRREQGDSTAAVQEFQRALDLAPNSAEAARELAELYSALGKFDEAEPLYIRSVKSRPTDWNGHFLLGYFYFDHERYPEAIAAFNQAKLLARDNVLVRYNLGGVYRAQGRYEDALREVQEALGIRSTASLYAQLGAVQYYQHRYQEAVSALEAATELAPNTYRYWGNLGIYAKWVPGNEAKSEAALRRAIELAVKAAAANKTDYSAAANLAEYRARLGDRKGAMAELSRIPESAKASVVTRFAIAYELTGQRDQAIAVVRQHMKNPASLTQIRDDPDLTAVWRAIQ